MADDAGSQTIRIATFNVSLYGQGPGDVADRLRGGGDADAQAIAAIVQTVRPDVLLVNEIDYDADGETARLLADLYFAKPAEGREGMTYAHVLAIPSNTGVDSGMDLNNNGALGEPVDAWGYGVYPGQYAMAIYSRFPIDRQQARTFQTYRWKELPGALRPVNPDTTQSYYPDEVWEQLRLSSKNHVDVPVDVNGTTVHLLASHPTPPVFDGREDRNGCRNHDEIRFWTEYLSGDSADFLIDDAGVRGGLDFEAPFVILGDLNADPHDGDGRTGAIRELLAHPHLQDPQPSSQGAVDAASGAAAKRQSGPAKLDTADFGGAGNLRVDYALPSRNIKVIRAEVFWPRRDQPEHRWIEATDHRLVWLEVVVP